MHVELLHVSYMKMTTLQWRRMQIESVCWGEEGAGVDESSENLDKQKNKKANSLNHAILIPEEGRSIPLTISI